MTSLIGRRIHIAGSMAKKVQDGSAEQITVAREFVRELVKAFLKEGATFVVPVDCEVLREEDQQPLLFDWLVLETILEHQRLRPQTAVRDPRPLIVAVQHHKNNEQIPDDKLPIWEALNEQDGLVYIENAGHWNMASKRMDLQAAQGDVLIALGGDEGVLYLANLYHDTGKPVIPLNFPVVSAGKGARRLFDLALMNLQTIRFYKLADGSSAHYRINRLNFSQKTVTEKRVEEVVALVKALRRPVAFAVRLLNPKVEGFHEVEDHFEAVIKPVAELMGYELVTIDGGKSEYSMVNQEIFENLHRASVVIVDMTGERPNCFIELGYALGRGLPVMVTAKEKTNLPFDTQPVPTRMWDPATPINKRKDEFKAYWEANAQRRRIVEADPLVP